LGFGEHEEYIEFFIDAGERPHVKMLVLAHQRALMCGAISLSPVRDVPFGWVYQAAGGAVAMGGLLLVINPGWTQDYLTRIRARLPGRVRDANPDRDTPGAR
jgi:hypothetical protein